MKKKVVGFCVFDENNRKYYDRFIKSLRKFHSEEELPILTWEEKKIKDYNDPHFFYRAKPIIARQLLKDYELVIGFDVDQIVTGSLDYIIEDKSYDAAAPLNWNRIDPQIYGVVSVWDISPTAYFNMGTVALRSREFTEKWFALCHSPHFFSYRYREQDLFSILAYYFDWRVLNLDSQNHWSGLISKAEMLRFELKGGKLICPPASDGFPNKEMEISILHFAGGSTSGDKFDYLKTHCKPEILEFLKGLYER